MRRVAGVLGIALALAACGGPADVDFPDGTTMDRLGRSGRIVVGIKYDQPGVGFKNPATGKVEGFDVRMAEIIAAGLGLEPDQIVYRETVTGDREEAIATGRVDIVIASYSITAEHRREVGQAGPYFVTGQQLLVREADKRRITGPERLSGTTVCSVIGSTSLTWAEQESKAQVFAARTYTDCVRMLLTRSVDAVVTDGAILLGYAAQQPDKLEVVGRQFTEERYGIGYRHGDLAFCRFLTDTVKRAMDNGDWAEAFADTLGRAGVAPPAKPVPDPCPPAHS